MKVTKTTFPRRLEDFTRLPFHSFSEKAGSRTLSAV
jgi:hypothetical protein